MQNFVTTNLYRTTKEQMGVLDTSTNSSVS